VFQSLISLEDQDIDCVLLAVTAYCNSRGVNVESSEGTRAVAVAVDVACTRGTRNLLDDLNRHFNA
jgi:hypothetical protein